MKHLLLAILLLPGCGQLKEKPTNIDSVYKSNFIIGHNDSSYRYAGNTVPLEKDTVYIHDTIIQPVVRRITIVDDSIIWIQKLNPSELLPHKK